MRALAHVLIFASTGCWIDNPRDCGIEPLESRRDPQTGTCVEYGDAEACQFCAEQPSTCRVASTGDIIKLDYPTCGRPCHSAREPSCLELPGCRAVYTEAGFFGCWNTAPLDLVSEGACTGLDAYECSRHDNCAAWYVKSDAGYETKSFDHCADEVAPPS